MELARAGSAFTLLELAVTIVIIAILAVLAVPLYSSMRARAQRVQCATNLRGLSVGANLFLQQNGMWPQIPSPTADEGSAQTYAQAWIDALKPFGPDEKTWICPTMQNGAGNPDYRKPDSVRIDYMPVPFDDKPTTPHQWPRQPWFVETGDVHGNGNLIIFTDGSISDLKSIIPKP